MTQLAIMCADNAAKYVFRGVGVVQTRQNRGVVSQHWRSEHTLQWRKASIHNQLQVAKLPLGEDNGWELLSLIIEPLAARRITCDKVLQDTA